MAVDLDAQARDRFGWSVAVSGDTTVVGAPFEDAGGGNAGAAYVFQQSFLTSTIVVDSTGDTNARDGLIT
ncbi:MAG: FG-GAP repeat protein, partial [Planctomycetes bacterium]|nr:FG-GAP repeat protein [Planctomycetota bacterium]